MRHSRILRRQWLFVAGTAVALGIYYWFFMDRPWIEGAKLNPYQVDEIQLVRRDGELPLQEEIISIRDKAWIRGLLSEWKDAAYVKEAFPPDNAILQGYRDRYFLYINDGAGMKLNAEIYSGHPGDGLTENGIMLVKDRYHYGLPSSMAELLAMDLDDILASGGKVSVTLDNWRPMAIINGEKHMSYFMGSSWGDSVQQEMEQVAVVTSALPDHIRYTKRSDISELLVDGAGTYTEGTPIYQYEGHYFIRNAKDTGTWSILLPEGQAAHRLEQDRDGEAVYWESYGSSRYFIVERDKGHEVYSAQDPNARESCILSWQEEKRAFVSPCTSIAYGVDGTPSEDGALPMKKWPSREWSGVLLYDYGVDG
ncbi:hypothetical protein M6D81_10115 [Paenibacillus sp. J5C_2022]|uniref:hypothetical protein n=1 Tax=Paenibacillus sp. J5C2022 TaxID=2977129 RepID=UPI0021D0CED3|nr:hypothetical protein [Paenibacillus sp. J5C2022]MCU6709066.1 hypothetical protein [Paenibacillus sp. J5C2022]